MKKLLKATAAMLLIAMLAAASAQAQGLKRVYNDDLNPVEQIDQALAQAQSSERFVICQVGGNWCPWCLRLANFVTTDTTISKVVSDNYVYIHVSYNPHQQATGEKAELTKEAMHRLGNPARFGFPVLVVLDAEGHVLHTQDSSFLEQGNGYDKDKVLRFLKSWTPAAVSAAAK